MAEDAKTIKDDMVVSLAYKLTVDGEVLDEAGEADAIVYLQGHQNIIPGLESELAGMKVGESKTVKVAPDGGYGEINEDAIDNISMGEFPDEISPEVGMELEMRDQEGAQLIGRVLEVHDEHVRMDFNHPLAGKELNFEVKVVEVREATEEEIAHGHVHEHGHHH